MARDREVYDDPERDIQNLYRDASESKAVEEIISQVDPVLVVPEEVDEETSDDEKVPLGPPRPIARRQCPGGVCTSNVYVCAAVREALDIQRELDVELKQQLSVPILEEKKNPVNITTLVTDKRRFWGTLQNRMLDKLDIFVKHTKTGFNRYYDMSNRQNITNAATLDQSIANLHKLAKKKIIFVQAQHHLHKHGAHIARFLQGKSTNPGMVQELVGGTVKFPMIDYSGGDKKVGYLSKPNDVLDCNGMVPIASGGTKIVDGFMKLSDSGGTVKSVPLTKESINDFLEINDLFTEIEQLQETEHLSVGEQKDINMKIQNMSNKIDTDFSDLGDKVDKIPDKPQFSAKQYSYLKENVLKPMAYKALWFLQKAYTHKNKIAAFATIVKIASGGELDLTQLTDMFQGGGGDMFQGGGEAMHREPIDPSFLFPEEPGVSPASYQAFFEKPLSQQFSELPPTVENRPLDYVDPSDVSRGLNWLIQTGFGMVVSSGLLGGLMRR